MEKGVAHLNLACKFDGKFPFVTNNIESNKYVECWSRRQPPKLVDYLQFSCDVFCNGTLLPNLLGSTLLPNQVMPAMSRRLDAGGKVSVNSYEFTSPYGMPLICEA